MPPIPNFYCMNRTKSRANLKILIFSDQSLEGWRKKGGGFLINFGSPSGYYAAQMAKPAITRRVVVTMRVLVAKMVAGFNQRIGLNLLDFPGVAKNRAPEAPKQDG